MFLELGVFGILALLVYSASLILYRLYWSPLAKFPGPKLAALSNWYEFYYDVFLQGQFTFKIRDLHKKYGMWRVFQYLPSCVYGCEQFSYLNHE